MYIDVSTVCPCFSWPPLSTIVTLLLRWGYCVCTSNARCDAFLYCLVLLVRIHSELSELLSPLLFVYGSLYTNDVVLLFYHVLRECPLECVKQWIIRTHFFNVRSQERIWGVICTVFISSSFRFGHRVLWLLTLRVFVLAEWVKKVRTFESHWACCVSVLMCCTWFSITFATFLCAVCFIFQWWVRWQWSC